MEENSSRPANRLIHATSPYLLQHAHNPVDWREWNEEALDYAKKTDKPILVSIGYAACHWCHVMERESFENADIAAIMNEHFVCIKVDREERPDIDQIYMEAVQAMQQQGGWPLNVFLTPSEEPFYGGTYFPPKVWAQLLLNISRAYKEQRKEIEASASTLRDHLRNTDVQRFAAQPAGAFQMSDLNRMKEILQSRFDPVWGGTDKSPKFVMPSIWLFLLRHFHITGDQDSLNMVTLTLDKIASGGMYDQLAGGFARYSVDGQWFAPHFEKMLYDNGQLLSLYAEAYSITKKPRYLSIINETFAWLENEMSHPDGGFFASQDADSEGVEGKFYTWTMDELSDLPSDLIEFLGVQPEGNWEHGRNILCYPSDPSQQERLHEVWQETRKKLLAKRNHRIPPPLDDKILTGWNAMAIQGLTDVYRATGNPIFIERATRAIRFIEANLLDGDTLYRSFRNRRGQTPGFLEDYAFLTQAYCSMYEVTFQENYLKQAEQWCNKTIELFFDADDRYFHYANSDSQLIARKKEIFDNVIPSSNAVMARVLWRLGSLLDRESWRQMATEMASRLQSLICDEPGYMCHWAILASELTTGLKEVVISGADAQRVRKGLQSHFAPQTVWLGTDHPSTLPLLEGRSPVPGKTTIYVCEQGRCQLPVTDIDKALELLKPV